MHALITFMVSVMASNIYSGWPYKLICNPLVDYIRSHVRLCAVLLYSKASNLCYLLTVGWYTVACKPNLYTYVYALMMESK